MGKRRVERVQDRANRVPVDTEEGAFLFVLADGLRDPALASAKVRAVGLAYSARRRRVASSETRFDAAVLPAAESGQSVSGRLLTGALSAWQSRV
jgi:hypothetical protein